MPDVPRQTAQPRDWKQLHLWQIQPIRDLLMLAAIIGVVYVGWVISIVTVPMLLALMLAYLFEPLVRFLTRRGYVSRPGVAIGLIVGAGLIIVLPVILGLGFAAIQGVKVGQSLASNVNWVIASVDKPDDAALRDLRPEGTAWREIRDFLVEQERKRRAQDERRSSSQGQDPAVAPPAFNRPLLSPAGTPPTDADLAALRSALGDAALAEFERALLSARQAWSRDNPAAPPTIAAAAEPALRAAAFDAQRPALESALDAREMEARARTVPNPDDTDIELHDATYFIVQWLRTNAAQIGRHALETGRGVFGVVWNWAAGFGVAAFAGFLTAFFFFFFCTGYGRVLQFWESLIPERRKGRVIELLHKMDRVIAGFVRGRLTICASLVVYYTIAYWAIGVPAPLILGPVIGLLSLVPYAANLGVPVAALLMWLNPAGAEGLQAQIWWILAAPIAVSVLAQILDDYILTPTIQGKSTDMDTPSILFASIAGGALAGVYGLLIAIPVTACLKILLNEVFWPQFRAWAGGHSSDFLPIAKD